MDYVISPSGTRATEIHKDLSLAFFIINSYTIPNLQPPFEGLKKIHKHMNMLKDICLCEMTEFWILRNELLKFHEVFPSGQLFFVAG